MTADSTFVMSDRVESAFRAALGSEHVIRGADASTHHDPYPYGTSATTPAAVVTPGSVEEIQAVLAIAREHRVPLWTVSTGRNLGYGGAAPRAGGNVVVDLRRMNRVLEVDDDLGFAVVEPGVSFIDLYAHLRRHGHRLLMSVPDIGWGSPIGNALERGFGYAPSWDHSAHLCGLEVVMANGRVVRTGMGAMSGNSAWHLYRGGFGPSIDGLFQQSNLGIVTRAGVSLLRQPETVVTCHVKAPRSDDVGALVEALRPLIVDGTIQSNAIIGNATVAASMMSDRGSWWAEAGAMPHDAVEAMAKGLQLGRWNARFGLYGPEVLTSARLQVVRRALERALPSAELSTRAYAGDVDPRQAHPADHAQLGIPGTALIRMAAWRGGNPAHTDFSLVCPATRADVDRQHALIQSGVERHGFDYAGGFTLGGRHAIALALLAFDRDDAEQSARVHQTMSDLIDAGAAAGYAPYRAHLNFMDRVSDLYDYGDHALRAVHETLKNALDPLGILAPGKQGIWPGRPGLIGEAQ